VTHGRRGGGLRKASGGGWGCFWIDAEGKGLNLSKSSDVNGTSGWEGGPGEST